MDDSDHRDKRTEFAQHLLEARPAVYRTVYKWMQDKWETDEIVGETEYRSLAYMEARQWKPKIRNMIAFELKIAVNLRNDSWSTRKKEGWQTLDNETDERNENYLVDPSSAGEAELQKPIYLKEMFDEVAWDFIFKGFTTYELKIYEMHEVDEMTPATIAYELRKDVHRLRYQLTKISAKVRYRAKKFLEHTGRTSIFKREA